jgi:hypothetical protein
MMYPVATRRYLGKSMSSACCTTRNGACGTERQEGCTQSVNSHASRSCVRGDGAYVPTELKLTHGHGMALVTVDWWHGTVGTHARPVRVCTYK